MSSSRDLWPSDIQTEDVVTPEEFLEEQASRLSDRTNGVLVGNVVRQELDDRIILGFEAEAPRIDARCRLFEVQHRQEFEYPAAFILPEPLPNYLKAKVYRPPRGIGAVMEASRALSGKGEWVDNEWLADSPNTFIEILEEVLGLATVKAAVLSLLARATRNGGDGNGTTENSES